jgi:hypothetical protein
LSPVKEGKSNKSQQKGRNLEKIERDERGRERCMGKRENLVEETDIAVVLCTRGPRSRQRRGTPLLLLLPTGQRG